MIKLKSLLIESHDNTHIVYHVSPYDFNPIELKSWSHLTVNEETAKNIVITHGYENRKYDKYFIYRYKLKSGNWLETDDKDDTLFHKGSWNKFALEVAIDKDKEKSLNAKIYKDLYLTNKIEFINPNTGDEIKRVLPGEKKNNLDFKSVIRHDEYNRYKNYFLQKAGVTDIIGQNNMLNYKPYELAFEWLNEKYDGVKYMNRLEVPNAVSYIVFNPKKSLYPIDKKEIYDF